MTDVITNQYRPAQVSPPGATIADFLEERGIRQAELAVRLGVTPKFVNELISGKASISPSTALGLESALNIPADFWLAREARYQEAISRAEALTELNANVGWLNELPLSDMIKFEWIRAQNTKAAYVGECLRFFGVASVSAWREYYIQKTICGAAYRAANRATATAGAVAAWLRAGERAAAEIECVPFNRDRLLQSLNEARSLTVVSEPRNFVPELQKRFGKCGVAVVFVRAPRFCPVSGATRWLSPTKALVQLSFRYLRNDALWFTFFHECGHIALHGKKMLFLEAKDMEGAEEREADRFAADHLIGPADWAGWQPVVISDATVKALAEKLGIAPGVIVGRLQHEKRLPWNRLNHLKVRYTWTDSDS